MSAERTHEALQSVCFVYEKPGRKTDYGQAITTYLLCITVFVLCTVALIARTNDQGKRDMPKSATHSVK